MLVSGSNKQLQSRTRCLFAGGRSASLSLRTIKRLFAPDALQSHDLAEVHAVDFDVGGRHGCVHAQNIKVFIDIGSSFCSRTRGSLVAACSTWHEALDQTVVPLHLDDRAMVGHGAAAFLAHHDLSERERHEQPLVSI